MIMKNLSKKFLLVVSSILIITSCDYVPPVIGEDNCDDGYIHESEPSELIGYLCDDLNVTDDEYYLQLSYSGHPTVTFYPNVYWNTLEDVPKTAEIEIRLYAAQKWALCPIIRAESFGAALTGGEQQCLYIYRNTQEIESNNYCGMLWKETLKAPLFDNPSHPGVTRLSVQYGCDQDDSFFVEIEYAD